MDVDVCVNNGYEILADPARGTTTHCRAFTIEDNTKILEYARSIGDTDSCTTCIENEVQQAQGLRVTLVGNLNADGSVSVQEVLDSGTTCTDRGLTESIASSCPSSTPGKFKVTLKNQKLI